MSFIWFRPDGPLRTPVQIAAEVHAVSLARGLDELASAICLMGIATEVGHTDASGNIQWWCPWNSANPDSKNFPYDSRSNDGRSSGYLQQQPGPNGEPWWGTASDMMTLSTAANNFLDRLSDNYGQAANNPALAGQFAQQVQGSAYPDRYAANWDQAWAALNAALAQAPTPEPEPTQAPEPAQPQQEASVTERPDFNEFSNPSTNFEGRAGTTTDLFLLHTQEGDETDDDAALALSNFLKSTEGTDNPRSYHYAIRQAGDGGVTVVDVISPDYAAWAVGSSNLRSINLCFAGTDASQSRDQWMTQSKAIDVAAYIADRDCKKYGIDPKVIPGPDYNSDPPGISDHRYCSDYLRDGNNHVDVGDNFPWDYFAQRVAYWQAALAPAPAPEPTPAPEPAPAPEQSPGQEPPPPPAAPVGPADDQLTLRWLMLGGKTVVEALAQIRDQVCGTNDRDKGGVV